MKTVFLAALVLLCAACFANGHRGAKWACGLKRFTVYCSGYYYFRYATVCNICYYKRSLSDEDENQLKAGFSCKFSDYDKNGDGKMTIDEFASAIGMSQSSSIVKETFDAADSDDSGDISCNEFKAAPFEFQDNCKPKC